jgi:hypothetical protein
MYAEKTRCRIYIPMGSNVSSERTIVSGNAESQVGAVIPVVDRDVFAESPGTYYARH